MLDAAGLRFADLVKTTIYLVEFSDFSAVNEIYGEFVVSPYPARATVGVASLPRGARVEIEAIARKK